MRPEQFRLTPDERADLVAYVDGELPEAHSRSIATKLTHSATARREVEMLEKTWELLDHLPRPELTEQFSEQTISEIRRLELTDRSWEPAVAAWSARVARLVAYVFFGAVFLGAGLRRDALGLAGSDAAPGSRLDARGTPRRISRGRVVRILEPTGRFRRVRWRCPLRADGAGSAETRRVSPGECAGRSARNLGGHDLSPPRQVRPMRLDNKHRSIRRWWCR